MGFISASSSCTGSVAVAGGSTSSLVIVAAGFGCSSSSRLRQCNWIGGCPWLPERREGV